MCNLFQELLDGLLLLDDKSISSPISLVEAVTQADTIIAYEAIKGKCDAALSNDGDFIMMCG